MLKIIGMPLQLSGISGNIFVRTPKPCADYPKFAGLPENEQPCMDNISENEFIEMLGQPETGKVQRIDAKALEPGIPEYIVSHVID